MTGPAGPAPPRAESTTSPGSTPATSHSPSKGSAPIIVDRLEDERRANWTTTYLERRARLRTVAIVVNDAELLAEQLSEAHGGTARARAFLLEVLEALR